MRQQDVGVAASRLGGSAEEGKKLGEPIGRKQGGRTTTARGHLGHNPQWLPSIKQPGCKMGKKQWVMEADAASWWA